MADPGSSARFPTTLWSRVVAAARRDASEDRNALAELCAVYWFPVYAFIRRKGNDPESAVLGRLNEWLTDADLACVRMPWALEKLPVSERAEWRAFWAEFEKLRTKAKAP